MLPTTQSLCQKLACMRKSSAHRQRRTHAHTHTHTLMHTCPITAFSRPCLSFSLSLNSHIFCHSSFSFDKRRPWFAEPLSGVSLLLSYSCSSVFFFILLSFHSHPDRRSLLLKQPTGISLTQSAHHQFVIIYSMIVFQS